MKKPYIAAINEQIEKGKRKQPGFREVYKGRYGVDWSEDGDGFIDESDVDGRWAAALAESKDLGVDYVQRIGSSNEIHFESIESINSIMRVHEELMPGFLYYNPKVGIKPMTRAMAYNDIVRGSRYDNINYAETRRFSGFFDPELRYDYSAIGLNKAYFADDWDEDRAYRTLNSEGTGWFSVNSRGIAEEAGYEDWEGLMFSIVTHEVGHTLGNAIFGRFNTVQDDNYNNDLKVRTLEELTDIFVEFGLLVEGENIVLTGKWGSDFRDMQTEVMKELLSKYGATNIHELFAESWAEYMMASRPRAFAQRVGRLMQDFMEEWIDHEFEGS
jgi:hypothetical protein